jgi:hypothetical protein
MKGYHLYPSNASKIPAANKCPLDTYQDQVAALVALPHLRSVRVV